MAEFDARASFEGIERERVTIGVSRAELARAADISDSTLTRLLQDRTRVPQPRTVRKLQAALVRLSAQRGAAE